MTPTPHTGSIPFEPVPTGFYFTVDHLSDIPLRYVKAIPGDTGSPYPTPLISPSVVPSDSGSYPYLKEDAQLFPAGHYRGAQVGNYSSALNQGSPMPNKPPGHSRDPFFSSGSRTGFGGDLVLESEVCDALYNVKTWRISGSAGLFSFDFSASAGRNTVVESGEVTVTPTEPPYGGRRGILGVSAHYYDSDYTDSETRHRNLTISFSLSQFPSWEGPDLVSPTPYGQVPSVSLALSYFDSGPYNEGWEETDEGPFPDFEFFVAESRYSLGVLLAPRILVSSTECSFLGQQIKLYYSGFDSPLSGISVDIEADEWWTNDDPWVEGWE